MTFKVESLEKKPRRFHFKLMERLNFKLNLTVLHNLINDYKQHKKFKPWKTKRNVL